MLEFQQPWWLLLLVLVPFFYWWYLRRGHSREGVLRFSSLALFDPTAVRSGSLKAGFLQSAKFLLLALVVLALARPRLTDVIRETRVEVIDIMLVLDISSPCERPTSSPTGWRRLKK